MFLTVWFLLVVCWIDIGHQDRVFGCKPFGKEIISDTLFHRRRQNQLIQNVHNGRFYARGQEEMLRVWHDMQEQWRTIGIKKKKKRVIFQFEY